MSLFKRFRFSVSPFIPFFFRNPTSHLSFHSHYCPLPFIHNVDNVVSPFHRMLSMSHTSPVIEIGRILGSLEMMKHYPTVRFLCKQMPLKGVVSNLVTLTTLLHCFCDLGYVNLAFSVLTNIFKIGYQPDAVTLATLLRGLCDEGHVSKAFQFYDKLEAEGFQLYEYTYWNLIYGACNIGDTRAAIHLLRMIEGKLTYPVTIYNMIFENLLKEKKLVSEAHDLYSEMIVKKISPDSFTYAILISGFCMVGQLGWAIGLFNEMSSKGISDVHVHKTMIKALYKGGKVKEAKTVLAVITKEEGVNYNSLKDGYFLSKQVKNVKGSNERVVHDVSYRSMIYDLYKNQKVDVTAINLTFLYIIRGMHDRGQPATKCHHLQW